MQKVESPEACVLCLRSVPLMQSHVVPKFVFRWLKETSGTGRLRLSDNVNVPVQDGVKLPLLCAECEQRFSKLESHFAQHFFRPLMDAARDGFVVDYDDRVYLCVLSMSFRCLVLQLRWLEQKRRHWRPLLEVLVEDWRRRLLGEVPSETVAEHHVFALSTLTQHPPGGPLPRGVNWYWMRGVDFTLAFSGNTELACYVKLPGIAIFSALQPSRLTGMDGTRIRLAGRLASPQRILNEDVGTFLVQVRPREVMPKFDAISPAQRAAIDRAYAKSNGRWEHSPAFDAGWADAMLMAANPSEE